MPRNVRNFWITGHVDGKATEVAFGPQGKDGGFDLTVLARNDGDIVRAVNVRGFLHSDGSLRLVVEPEGGASQFGGAANGGLRYTFKR